MGYEATKRIKIVPAEVVVEEHRRHVYKCAGCCDANAKGGDTKSVIAHAPQPNPPILGSFATLSLIEYVINGKYVISLPLYRYPLQTPAGNALNLREFTAMSSLTLPPEYPLPKLARKMKNHMEEKPRNCKPVQDGHGRNGR